MLSAFNLFSSSFFPFMKSFWNAEIERKRESNFSWWGFFRESVSTIWTKEDLYNAILSHVNMTRAKIIRLKDCVWLSLHEWIYRKIFLNCFIIKHCHVIRYKLFSQVGSLFLIHSMTNYMHQTVLNYINLSKSYMNYLFFAISFSFVFPGLASIYTFVWETMMCLPLWANDKRKTYSIRMHAWPIVVHKIHEKLENKKKQTKNLNIYPHFIWFSWNIRTYHIHSHFAIMYSFCVWIF